jgi:hypothetical protein
MSINCGRLGSSNITEEMSTEILSTFEMLKEV